ncbi:hypothetical protein BD560DRAFT_398212 [Blakeslea trispora]|nr:hypothetical protein BD560DRAFT_398212 [Blakeslea trispora]
MSIVCLSRPSTFNTKAQAFKSNVCSGRGKSYCLVHRRYFETSWCPDCSRSSRKFLYNIIQSFL